jgi:hypothetical protein
MLVFDLNIIVDSRFNPHACQNVISGKLNSVGINQFHNSIRGPPINIAVSISNPII